MPGLSPALALLALLAAAPLSAAPQEFTFDKRHSQIIFYVDHMGFSTSEGEFHDFTGGYTFDPDNWEASSVTVEIETASIDMDDAGWSEEMAGPNFFDAEKYPTVKFESTKLEKTGENTGRLHGNLTMLGVTKPIVIDLRYNKTGLNPVTKKQKTGFSGTTKFRRSDFGMNYGIDLGFGDEVDVRLEIEGTLKQ